MSTLEIPKADWPKFFDLFSRQHEGWITTLELMGSDLGDQFEAEQYSFNGISYDPKGTGRGSIDIELDLDPVRRVDHTVTRPSRVMLMLTELGAHEGLEIESEDGVKTLVRFRTAEFPEEITGAVDEELTRKMQELLNKLAQKKRRAGS